MKKFLVFSIILHTIVFCWRTIEPETFDSTPIEVNYPDIPDSSTPPNKTNPGGPKRIGNDGEGINDLPLGDKLTAENYIQRIRELIEPVWVAGIKERIKFRQKSKYPVIKCVTSIIILVNSSGFIEKTNVILSCGQDLHFDQIALGVWDRNLPPPPKNLLENGILEIVWNFVIR